MMLAFKEVFALHELKMIVTIYLLVTGVVLLVKKQEPQFIRRMKIEPLKQKKLKTSVGVVIVLAALLYPVEKCLVMLPGISTDFVELFWGGGLIVASVVLVSLINYYQK